jgi:hypothetical protein
MDQTVIPANSNPTEQSTCLLDTQSTALVFKWNLFSDFTALLNQATWLYYWAPRAHAFWTFRFGLKSIVWTTTAIIHR